MTFAQKTRHVLARISEAIMSAAGVSIVLRVFARLFQNITRATMPLTAAVFAVSSLAYFYFEEDPV